MDKNELKTILKRLIDEALVIAPSIKRVETGGKYGTVTDEELNVDAFVTWEIESRSILSQLSNSYPIFKDIYKDYTDEKNASKRYHSKSILVHKIQQLLAGALVMLDSPLLEPQTNILPSIKQLSVDSSYAFIAMPIDPDDHQLIDVLDAIKEAAKKCDIHAERIDEPQSNERITDRILESISRAGYIIVDLTHSRPNVFFEAGYAHGLGKIPIYIARQGSKLEFDLKDYPVLFFKNLRELKDSLEKRLKGLSTSTGP
ncbi:hypothetical protein BuS5_03848 [Desulfosarcina sp. BuS5]|uniref:hypothetical protein n=1 Tax=Desulfosarcina sp. BuS5 TaxID=933262 RepID=UPI00068898DD|nr:hypothetical protein [Desulfosarcina sp. BuS5]WDN90877.1 hypothetical protein BuS5_03848 [Desulfosarcina sp. BuS5]